MGLDSEESDSSILEFDPEDNADIMEFKIAGDSQESDDSTQPNLNDLAGLSEAVQKGFNISKADFNLLFPALVPAFGLKKKEWRWILSDQLQDVAWNMVAFESLQLEAATKHLVQALVKGHKANSAAFDDVVSGKGQGLVFLLHGNKAWTGQDAHGWKIEYFQGVLFLTTNRKQDFDEAFKSRIHVTISYGDLSDEAQSKIWPQLITVNKDVQVDDSWTDAAFAALGKLKFNGRMIKNILRTAVAYANADEKSLGLRHVLPIVQTELKDVDEESSVKTDSSESTKARAKAALHDLQRLLDEKPSQESKS
ncbi:hypothetical protein ACJ41O_015159 [Fusarium nematophilum]